MGNMTPENGATRGDLYSSGCLVVRSYTIIKCSGGARGPLGAGLLLLPFRFVVGAVAESLLGAGNTDSLADSPTATKRVKSGVTARSVIRMAVIPQESRCFPSDPWPVVQVK